jgi:hypothetical protein
MVAGFRHCVTRPGLSANKQKMNVEGPVLNWPFLRTISLITAVVSFGLEAWLVLLLIKRKAQERFQSFVSYIAVAALVSLTRPLLIHFLWVHFYVYWASELLLILLSIAALNQVFWYTYDEMHFLWWLRLVYYGAILLALGITIRMAIVSPTVQEHPLISFILDAEIAANMVRAGIVAVFAVMVEPMAVEFERYAFGIILGFGASSIGPVLAYFVIYISGIKYQGPARIFSSLSYIVALIMWLRVFSLPDTQPKRMEPPIPPEEMWDTIEGYLKALGVSRKRKK